MNVQAQYLVDVKAGTARLAVVGRASYLNCMGVAKFFDGLLEDGVCRELYADFKNCTGMDSTFLGILTGAALRFMKMRPAGRMVLQNLSERNLELVENLGLDKILTVDRAVCAVEFCAEMESAGPGAPATQEKMLEAHENLVEANPANLAKFEDVIAYLKRREDGAKGEGR